MLSEKIWQEMKRWDSGVCWEDMLASIIKVIIHQQWKSEWKVTIFSHSMAQLISDILLCTPSHGRAKAERPAKTYIPQLCVNTGYNLEDLPGAMDKRDRWWERVRKIQAGSSSWWWWWWWHKEFYTTCMQHSLRNLILKVKCKRFFKGFKLVSQT